MHKFYSILLCRCGKSVSLLVTVFCPISVAINNDGDSTAAGRYAAASTNDGETPASVLRGDSMKEHLLTLKYITNNYRQICSWQLVEDAYL